jgi:diadenosine tetraphosphate (Ap4A) HIT family hydrolase
MSFDAECLICQTVRDGRLTVYSDELWHAAILPGLEVPGWLTLQTRRHTEQVTGMNAEEAATFGPRLVLISEAIKAVTDAERVYLYAFGDGVPHWHVLLAPRSADLPVEARHGHYFDDREQYRDPEQARVVAAAIRDQLVATAL